MDTTGKRRLDASTAWVLLPREERALPATIIDGVRVAQSILTEAGGQAAEFDRVIGRKPCLATVLVGDDPASHTYVRMKTNRCRTTGLESRSHRVAAAATTSEIVDLVTSLSADDSVTKRSTWIRKKWLLTPASPRHRRRAPTTEHGCQRPVQPLFIAELTAMTSMTMPSSA